jgi:hypothetical protein
MTDEEQRLEQDRLGRENWRMWGPYLAERAWGTVREDYSADGDAWVYFPHHQARARAYRWNEDGLLGISDERQLLCFALALWNGADPHLKERPFGLANAEGNHGEDVKELYYYLDNLPSHAYMKGLYKYPKRAFPYDDLVRENGRRNRDEAEYELLDTGIFDDDRYFDVLIEYAKAAPDDILIRFTVTNRGTEAAALELLPTLWFRNTWAWGYDDRRPHIAAAEPHADKVEAAAATVLRAEHHALGTYWLVGEHLPQAPESLFTDNDSNVRRLFGDAAAPAGYFKDGIDDYVVGGERDAVNPACTGTKAALRYRLDIAPGAAQTVRLRLTTQVPQAAAFGAPFDQVFEQRRREADAFHATLAPAHLNEDTRNVQRQAFAGLLWNKQFYNYNVMKWLHGDPAQPLPPDARWCGRNREWLHVNANAVMSMPDKWEYPWFAAWDLAFHCIPLALVDADFAKEQLILLLREWFTHPNGQVPAYEWSLGDVNPPVHAWAALRVFRIERRLRGSGDLRFLKRVFHKLLLNFTWWVNRKDPEGRNVFQGGFLGLDNIGVFDRSAAPPFDGTIDQSDGTSWMAMYCLNMLAIALELARQDDSYEDVATKFLEHFFYISQAMNDRPAARGDDGVDLWDEEDGFYYDLLRFTGGGQRFLRVRSWVGLIPLLAVETLDADLLDALPQFRARMDWFLGHRPDLCRNAASVTRPGRDGRRLFAVVNELRLRKILARVLDEGEFLSPYGIRSVSRFHRDHPFRIALDGHCYEVGYQPAESDSGLFGGNSNWRGPVWFPLNYLLIEALQKFDFYHCSGFSVECPLGSGRMLTLGRVARELSQRLIRIFLRAEDGRRPVFGGSEKLQTDPNFRDLISFHEYFHGDNGAGLGASHQTGWTALVAKLIQQSGA